MPSDHVVVLNNVLVAVVVFGEDGSCWNSPPVVVVVFSEDGSCWNSPPVVVGGGTATLKLNGVLCNADGLT